MARLPTRERAEAKLPTREPAGVRHLTQAPVGVKLPLIPTLTPERAAVVEETPLGRTRTDPPAPVRGRGNEKLKVKSEK